MSRVKTKTVQSALSALDDILASDDRDLYDFNPHPAKLHLCSRKGVLCSLIVETHDYQFIDEAREPSISILALFYFDEYGC